MRLGVVETFLIRYHEKNIPFLSWERHESVILPHIAQFPVKLRMTDRKEAWY